ncbi:MAG: hypothetical protein ACRD2A_12105, partial [Vicinamibacterales bacterium]
PGPAHPSTAQLSSGRSARMLQVLKQEDVSMESRAKLLGHPIHPIFAASAWLRWLTPQEPSALALTLSFGGFVLALITGWLGGELVDRLGVGVDEGAHLNAPSSLTTDRAA